MKEVNKDYFYSKINPLDVICRVIGNFPYTTIFETKDRILKGKIIENYTDGIKYRYPIVKKYYTDL